MRMWMIPVRVFELKVGNFIHRDVRYQITHLIRLLALELFQESRDEREIIQTCFWSGNATTIFPEIP